MVEIADIGTLTAQVATVSTLVKVIVDLLKLYIPKVNQTAEIKYLSSMLISTAITLFTGISIFETEHQAMFYLGTIGAGLVAGLGSNTVHEVLKILQTVKDIKKQSKDK